MKTAVFSSHGFDRPSLAKAAEGKHELVYYTEELHLQTVHLAEGCEAVALFTSDDAAGPVLEALYAIGVRFVALRSAGYNHCNLATAKRLGIGVARVPGYSPYAIAEYATALLMALNRKIVEAQWLIAQQDFRLDSLVGFDVHGKTVGIVGLGKTGEAFARIMHGFGANLLCTDIVPNEAVAKELGIEYVPLDALCNRADIVSIHCPLTPETKYLFGKAQFETMRHGAIFINTARGEIVDTAALIDALEEGKIAAAGLDVYEHEKGLFFFDHREDEMTDPLFARLLKQKNVLVTGHQAFLTVNALGGIAQTTMANLDAFAAGTPSGNEL